MLVDNHGLCVCASLGVDFHITLMVMTKAMMFVDHSRRGNAAGKSDGKRDELDRELHYC